MKIRDLEPGSQSWHAWRKEGIGASDIPIIVGTNPYQSPLQLWEDKCDFAPPFSGNHFTAHGNESEPKARRWLNHHLQLCLAPVCIEDEENPIFRASLDGYDPVHNVLMEIKAPLSDDKLNDMAASAAIPSSWYDQLQWQMMLARPAEAHLAVWDYRTNTCVLRRVHPNGERQEELKKAALEFWEYVRSGEAPPSLETDHPLDDDPKKKEVLELWGQVRESRMAFEKAEKEYKEMIAKMCPHNVNCAGYRVTHYAGKKSYDWKRMSEDGINLEKYARTSGPYIQIRPPKK